MSEKEQKKKSEKKTKWIKGGKILEGSFNCVASQKKIEQKSVLVELFCLHSMSCSDLFL